MIHKTEKSPFSHIPENKGILFVCDNFFNSVIGNQNFFWLESDSGRTMTVA